MSKNLSFVSLIVLLVGLAFSSCNNNQIDGCTDPTATNYDPAATNDDGSCQYNTNSNNEAKVVFWFSEATTSAYLYTDSITSFTFIVDGTVEGTHNLLVWDAAGPACGAANHVTVTRTVPQGQIQFFPYFMVTQTGDTAITGAFQFYGGQCIPTEITY